MTTLVRLVGDPKRWLSARSRAAANPANAIDPNNIPVEMLREFILPEKDNGLMSMFAIEQEEEYLQVAAALSMSAKDCLARVVFVSASLEAFEDAGLSMVNDAKGATGVQVVDRRHRSIEVKDQATLNAVAAVFVKGVDQEFQAAELYKGILLHAQSSAYDFREIADKGSGGDIPWGGVRKMVGAGYFAISY